MNLLEFKAERSARFDRLGRELSTEVEKALREYAAGDADWADGLADAATVLWLEGYSGIDRSGRPDEKAVKKRILANLANTSTPSDPPSEVQVGRVTNWLVSYVVNDSANAAGDKIGNPLKRWTTMHDSSVRHAHAELDGQTIRMSGTFDVNGSALRFPGDPVGSPENWIECRCVLAVGVLNRKASNRGMEFVVAGVPTKKQEPTAPAEETQPAPEVDDPEEIADDPNIDDEELVDDVTEIPIHGVAASEGKPSGDGRMFALGALSNRDLPLPVRFEFVGNHGGDTSMVDTIGRIDNMWLDPATNEYRYTGAIIMNSEHGPLAVEGIIDGRYRSISVEVDNVALDVSEERAAMKARILEEQDRVEPADAEVSAPAKMSDEEIESLLDVFIGDGTMPLTTFSQARICGFTIVPIGAMSDAYVALGHEFKDQLDEKDAAALTACGCNADGLTAAELTEKFSELQDWEITELIGEPADRADFDFHTSFAEIDEGSWDGSAGNYTDEQWYAATIIHTNGDSKVKGDNKLPIKTPDGKLSRAGVHAAAGRVDQTDASPEQISAAKASLRAAYKQLGEEPPEGLTAGGAFAPGTHDGPGWITNPRATARIRRYWVRGKGAAKIRWGEPGDFNRCRKQLAKYVQNPDWLAGMCANMHKEAIGVWPGMEDGGRKGKHHSLTGLTASGSLAITASGRKKRVLPADAFRDPQLTQLTQLTVTDDDRVFGHLAAWGTCHIGMDGVCTTPPFSSTGYRYAHIGTVDTTEGPVGVGHLTMGIGHIDPRVNAAAATAHYDRDDATVADVVFGEDAFGIWYAGMIRPGVSDDRVADFKANGALSGDWRWFGNDLELVAATAVNCGGFPIPRPALYASGGHQMALVASGIVTPEFAAEVKAATMEMTAENVAAIARNAVLDYVHQTELRQEFSETKAKYDGSIRALRIQRARAKVTTRKE